MWCPKFLSWNLNFAVINLYRLTVIWLTKVFFVLKTWPIKFVKQFPLKQDLKKNVFQNVNLRNIALADIFLVSGFQVTILDGHYINILNAQSVLSFYVFQNEVSQYVPRNYIYSLTSWDPFLVVGGQNLCSKYKSRSTLDYS